MKALKAVEKYGKIRLPKTPKMVHAELNGFGVLTWVENDKTVTGPVSLQNQIRCDWEPVESDEVRELKQELRHISRQNKELMRIVGDRALRDMNDAFADFEKDQHINRVVIDEVFWRETDEAYAMPDVDGEPAKTDIWRKLPSMGPCRMILEFKK